MKRRTLLGLAGLAPAVTLGAPTPTLASPLGKGDVPDYLRPGGEFDRYLSGLAAEDKFSGTVLLAHHYQPVIDRAYGMADKARGIRNAEDTIYCLASITKMFTSTAIAQLAAAGKLAYDDTLGTYVDGFPKAIADSVTIEHLLTHTSGLGRPAGGENNPEWDSVEEFWHETLATIRELPLRFPPGTQYLYSNDGFFMLGAIIAAVSGAGAEDGPAYYDYMRTRIFQAAGMVDSDFLTRPERLANRRVAHPYELQESGKRVDVLSEQGFAGHPGGNSLATAPDLVRFVRATQDGTLVPSDRVNGGGAGRGISTFLQFFPDHGWTVVILCNYDQVGIRDLTSRIEQAITGEGCA